MKRWSMFKSMGIVALLWGFLPISAIGDGDTVDLNQLAMVTNQELDSQRGGFVIDDGLPISFGVIQTSSINGEVLTINTWNGHQGDSMLQRQVGGIPATVIRSGLGNDLTPIKLDNVMPGGLTIIQNTLDQQVIRNMTVISAEVSNLNVLRQTNLSLSLSSQMIHAVR